jgi:hypothetical protein
MSPTYYGCCSAMGKCVCVKEYFCARSLVQTSEQTIFFPQCYFLIKILLHNKPTLFNIIVWPMMEKLGVAWIGSYLYPSKKPISKRQVKNVELRKHFFWSQWGHQKVPENSRDILRCHQLHISILRSTQILVLVPMWNIRLSMTV